MQSDRARENFKNWLEIHGLNANSAAKAAGISVSSIYNFLDGRSQSLSVGVLTKLAKVVGDSVDAILTGALSTAQSHAYVTHRVGGRGEMFDIKAAGEELVAVTLPPGGVPTIGISAAVVDGHGLHPVPADWLVFFETEPSEPEPLIGQVAVVRFSGGGPRPVIRTVRRGSRPEAYNLQAFGGELVEGVEIVAAHRVVSFAAPTEAPTA